MSALLNRLAPDFVLPAVTGGRFALSDWRGFVVVLNFWSAECQWSRRADVMLVYRQLTWHPKGVRILGINSNINETETEIAYEIEKRHVKYPLLLDYEHKVADLYKAETTPHFYVADRQGIVRYIGALDDADSKQREPKNQYLDRVVNAVLDNRQPDPALTPAYGCPIMRQLSGNGGASPPARERK